MRVFSYRHIRIYFLTLSIILIVFAKTFFTINTNTVQFHADEMYWIQTGRILPYILSKNFTSVYWHEHMGFTNFNGAKWIYGIGLLLFGHKNFENIGIPPETYYKWNSYEGYPFPRQHELFVILQHGRIISALIASVSMGVLFMLTFYITKNIFSSIVSVLLFVIHPIFRTISTHAFADSIFLLGELCIYLCTYYYLPTLNDKHKIYQYILTGIILGFTISTKINGYIFVPVVFGIIMYQNYKAYISNADTLIRILTIFLSMSLTFIIVNPNLVFYSSYSLPMMIADRIQITRIHMEYFHAVDAQHVLNTIPKRIESLVKHVFTIPIILSFLLTILTISFSKKRKYMLSIFFKIFSHASYIFIALLLYVVFDEERYFLPLLPFMCIIGSLWADTRFRDPKLRV